MKIPKQIMSKQIRVKCLDCSGSSMVEVKYCTCMDCPLWFFRFGVYPATYIKAHGENSKSLFDKTEFKEGGRFDPSKPASEIRMRDKKLPSEGE